MICTSCGTSSHQPDHAPSAAISRQSSHSTGSSFNSPAMYGENVESYLFDGWNMAPPIGDESPFPHPMQMADPDFLPADSTSSSFPASPLLSNDDDVIGELGPASEQFRLLGHEATAMDHAPPDLAGQRSSALCRGHGRRVERTMNVPGNLWEHVILDRESMRAILAQTTVQDRKERRREQNRRAQQNYRARKDAIVQSLQLKIRHQVEEIAELNKANQRLTHHLQVLQNEHQASKGLES